MQKTVENFNSLDFMGHHRRITELAEKEIYVMAKNFNIIPYSRSIRYDLRMAWHNDVPINMYVQAPKDDRDRSIIFKNVLDYANSIYFGGLEMPSTYCIVCDSKNWMELTHEGKQFNYKNIRGTVYRNDGKGATDKVETFKKLVKNLKPFSLEDIDKEYVKQKTEERVREIFAS